MLTLIKRPRSRSILAPPILTTIRGLIGVPAEESSGGVLMTAIEKSGLSIPATEHMANERGSDIVLGRFIAENIPAAPPLFAIGIRLHWKYLWHTYHREMKEAEFACFSQNSALFLQSW